MPETATRTRAARTTVTPPAPFQLEFATQVLAPKIAPILKAGVDSKADLLTKFNKATGANWSASSLNFYLDLLGIEFHRTVVVGVNPKKAPPGVVPPTPSSGGTEGQFDNE